MNLINQPAAGPVPGAFAVDVSRGSSNTRVSSEWFNRPDDERFLSLGDLYESVRRRARQAHSQVIDSRSIRVEPSRSRSSQLALMLANNDRPIAPTNWSFGQLCSMVGAPASYLRDLPAALAGINLQHGLQNHRSEQVQLLQTEDGRTELRAITGPDYIHYLNSQPCLTDGSLIFHPIAEPLARP